MAYVEEVILVSGKDWNAQNECVAEVVTVYLGPYDALYQMLRLVPKQGSLFSQDSHRRSNIGNFEVAPEILRCHLQSPLKSSLQTLRVDDLTLPRYLAFRPAAPASALPQR